MGGAGAWPGAGAGTGAGLWGRRRPTVLVTAVLLALLAAVLGPGAACARDDGSTGGAAGPAGSVGSAGSAGPPGSAGDSGAAAAPASPASPSSPVSPSSPPRAAPWRARPVVTLRFDVAADRHTVRGRETVRFTPDLRVCELVFRAWPNKPETAAAGNALTVTSVEVDGAAVTPTREAAGAPPGAPGTLVRVPLRRCVGAGSAVSAKLAFTLVLGVNTPERVGYVPGAAVAWFATAFPLLAWERGRGWMTDPAVRQVGEMVGSEEFRLASLQVVAPEGDQVLGTGRLVRAGPGPRSATRLHEFAADAVRDVAVTVGRLRVLERSVDGVRLHLGVPATGTRTPAEMWAALVASSVRRLAGLLGPFPYPDLWVTVAPTVPTGIEFPGAVQYGDVDPVSFLALVSHELAHMYFYGLVGNDQGRDPWLDEAFATYAQAVVDHDEASYLGKRVPPDALGRLGAPMTYWAGRSTLTYAGGVYQQGAAALLEARQQVGAARFDAAVRAYISTNAHRVAVPADVAVALRGLPAAEKVLRDAGAFDQGRG